MATPGPTRAWGDCPTCEGRGQVWDDGHGPNDRQPFVDPCPTCAAYFKAVDEARAQGAAEATERAAVIVESVEPGPVSEALGLPIREALAKVAAAIRAAGDTVKGGTSDGK